MNPLRRPSPSTNEARSGGNRVDLEENHVDPAARPGGGGAAPAPGASSVTSSLALPGGDDAPPGARPPGGPPPVTTGGSPGPAAHPVARLGGAVLRPDAVAWHGGMPPAPTVSSGAWAGGGSLAPGAALWIGGGPTAHGASSARPGGAPPAPVASSGVRSGSTPPASTVLSGGLQYPPSVGAGSGWPEWWHGVASAALGPGLLPPDPSSAAVLSGAGMESSTMNVELGGTNQAQPAAVPRRRGKRPATDEGAATEPATSTRGKGKRAAKPPLPPAQDVLDLTDSSSEPDDDEWTGKTVELFRSAQQILDATAILASKYFCTYLDKNEPRISNQSGYGWLMETLNTPRGSLKMFRMDASLFYKLHDLLENIIMLMPDTQIVQDI